jgi:shikimate kinase
MSHIFLYGPSGVGKSTVGEILARNLKLSLVDSDHVIEMNAGISVPTIMQEYGEIGMRDLETAALKQIVHGSEAIVALGGGALLREENRALVEKCGTVILLMAELPTLVERLRNDPHERPLLAGDLESKLASYLERRAKHYASFPLKVQVDGKGPEQIAR